MAPSAITPPASSLSSLPPFPSDLPLAPIAVVSSAELYSQSADAQAKILEAAQTYGFFYLDMRDSTDGRALLADAEELLSIAAEAFALPDNEKASHALRKGESLFGYKARGTVKQTDASLRPDSTEFFNVGKDHVHGLAAPRPNQYPAAIEGARELLQGFTARAHACGLEVLRALALRLGLQRDAFAELNRFECLAGDHCRLTRKPAVVEGREGEGAVGLPSHTDFGSVTVLFNWLGGLQIESRTEGREGEWEWVKPLEGHAIVNLGDAMVKFTNGALKSAKHRVVPSPGKQAAHDRYSVVYFVRPHNDALMKPVAEFDTGKHVKVGGKVSVEDEDNRVYTAGEWMVKRAIQMGS